MVVGATKAIAPPLAQSNGRCRGAQPWPFDTWQMRVDDGNHACGASNVPPLRMSAWSSPLPSGSQRGWVCFFQSYHIRNFDWRLFDEGF